MQKWEMEQVFSSSCELTGQTLQTSLWDRTPLPPALLHSHSDTWVQAARSVKGAMSAEDRAGLSQRDRPPNCVTLGLYTHLGNGPQGPATSVRL